MNANGNANANKKIPFNPNPMLFIKKERNRTTKKTRSNELNLDIVFFGEIKIDNKTYYKYAYYISDRNVGFLQLTAQRRAQQLEKKLERPKTQLLTFSSSPQNRRRPVIDYDISRKQTFRNVLTVNKISKNKVNYDLNEILSYVSFRPDPNGIELSELKKKDNNFPFKIIRKSKLFSFKLNEPVILFGEITINGNNYYQYVSYKSKGIGSNNGVSFRKLSNNSSDLKKFRNKTNINSNINSNTTQTNKKTYLYFIKIDDVEPRELLHQLLQMIKDERNSKRNPSLFKTIYQCVSTHLYEGNNIGLEGIQLQEMR